MATATVAVRKRKAESVKVNYAWRSGSKISASAQVVGRRLAQILRRRNGLGLSAEDIVEDAKGETSPMHSYVFGLSDKNAAWQHRLSRAREILRSIVVVSGDTAKNLPPVRLFVHIDESENVGRGLYVLTERAMSDETMRQSILRRALGEAQDWRKRYDGYKELARVYEAIDSVEV